MPIRCTIAQTIGIPSKIVVLNRHNIPSCHVMYEMLPCLEDDNFPALELLIWSQDSMNNSIRARTLRDEQ